MGEVHTEDDIAGPQVRAADQGAASRGSSLRLHSTPTGTLHQVGQEAEWWFITMCQMTYD